ncbi:hypothetical protein ACC687_40440, partial [Rhizobium ruizarguesonis]
MIGFQITNKICVIDFETLAHLIACPTRRIFDATNAISRLMQRHPIGFAKQRERRRKLGDGGGVKARSRR